MSHANTMYENVCGVHAHLKATNQRGGLAYIAEKVRWAPRTIQKVYTNVSSVRKPALANALAELSYDTLRPPWSRHTEHLLRRVREAKDDPHSKKELLREYSLSMQRYVRALFATKHRDIGVGQSGLGQEH